MSLIVTALTTILLALSLAGVVAGGVKSGGAMSRYSSGIRQTAEDFQNVDLDQVQADQRTAPLEVAQGLAEAAMSAQTIGSPDVAANPVGMGFTDGMSIGQLAVGYAEDSSAEDSSADEEGDESEDGAENGSTENGAEDGSASGDTGSSGQTGTQGTDTGSPVEQAAPTYYVAWYADNIGFKPIWISSVETYREESIASNWPGGGLDPNVKLVKVAITGAFKTETEALEAVASQLSNKRIAGGIYAGMPLADIGGETHDVEYINWQSFWE